MFEAHIDPPQPLRIPPYRGWAFARPCEPGSTGGDRLAASVTDAGLVFLVADAAGHGARGQRFWDQAGPCVGVHWERLLRTGCALEDLEAFARGLNADLYREGEHLALAVGALGTDGHLRHATCGYGVHALPSGPDGARWPESTEPVVGWKLGWFSTEEWVAAERAFVGRELQGISRVVVLSDGFLGEDHRDTEQTLQTVKDLGRDCARLDARRAVERIRALPHADDDATVLALEAPIGA